MMIGQSGAILYAMPHNMIAQWILCLAYFKHRYTHLLTFECLKDVASQYMTICTIYMGFIKLINHILNIMCLKPYYIHHLMSWRVSKLILDIDDQNVVYVFASKCNHVAYLN